MLFYPFILPVRARHNHFSTLTIHPVRESSSSSLFPRLLPLLYPPFHLSSPSNVTVVRRTDSRRTVLETAVGTETFLVAIFFVFVLYCCFCVEWPTCEENGHLSISETGSNTTFCLIHSEVRFVARCPWDNFWNRPPPSCHLLRPRT